MTYQDYIQQAITKLNDTSVEVLKDAAIKANADFTLDGVILDGILAALEEKMNEAEFVEFCETL